MRERGDLSLVGVVVIFEYCNAVVVCVVRTELLKGVNIFSYSKFGNVEPSQHCASH